MSAPTSEDMEPKYYVKHNDRIPSDAEVDAILRRHPELPTHFIAVLRGYKPPAPTLYNRLAQRAARGDLIQFKPGRTIAKHFSYCLNETGNRDTKKRAHRILESMCKAGVEIGARNTKDIEYIPWQELILSPSMPRTLLDTMDAGKSPHLIKLEKGHLLPDGAPFRLYHKPTDTHVNVIDEIDRDTEPLTTTQERRNIEAKFEHYHEFFKEKIWRTHYGFRNCLVRFLTVEEANKRAMMRLWEKKFGPSKYMLFGTVKDEFYETRYSPADGAMFLMAYERVGNPPYYLNRFSDWHRPPM